MIILPLRRPPLVIVIYLESLEADPTSAGNLNITANYIENPIIQHINYDT
jgi:hypothetical protein